MTRDPVCPPPAHAAEPGFLLALDRAAIAALVRTRLGAGDGLLDLHADYVRWKELDGSLVGYRATLRQGNGTIDAYVTVRTAAPHRLADEAERLQHRADDEWSGLGGVALVPEHGVLLLGFPIDRAMHDLRRMVRASKVRNLVLATCPGLVPDGTRIGKSRSSFRLVRYKPERRAVLQWRLGCLDAGDAVRATPAVWLRLHAEATVARTAKATAAAAANGVRCPRTLGVAHERLALEEHVEGRPFPQPGDGRTVDRGELAAAAAVVARLHGTPAPAGLPFVGAVHELDRALRAADDLARLLPAVGERAHALADRLAAHVPAGGPTVFAHGDLHPGQLLLDGHDAALVDFDRACVATVAHDLATFHAHCVLADRRHGAAFAAAFRTAYAAQRPLPAANELDWWTAAALLRLATAPFRALRADWPTAARELLAAAEHALPAAAARDRA